MQYSKLKDWYSDGRGYERERDVIGTFAKWYRKGNLELHHGSGRNVEEIFGLPYTSTSDYAACWNCQAEATLKGSPWMYFEGLAISEGDNPKILAVFSIRDPEGNEVGWEDVIIG